MNSVKEQVQTWIKDGVEMTDYKEYGRGRPKLGHSDIHVYLHCRQITNRVSERIVEDEIG